jgi:hypothetical protein
MLKTNGDVTLCRMCGCTSAELFDQHDWSCESCRRRSDSQSTPLIGNCLQKLSQGGAPGRRAADIEGRSRSQPLRHVQDALGLRFLTDRPFGLGRHENRTNREARGPRTAISSAAALAMRRTSTIVLRAVIAAEGSMDVPPSVSAGWLAVFRQAFDLSAFTAPSRNNVLGDH